MTTAQREGRYPALDGMRALASLAVVFTHVGYATGRALQPDLEGALLARGNFGVTVFFLLSGFLLYRPFARYSFGVGQRPSLTAYFCRRAFRIFPALWLAATVTILVLSETRFVSWSNWASYVFVVQTYNDHDYDPDLSQLWTLVVEVSFYALLPILAWLVGGPKRGPDAVLRRQLTLIIAMVVVTELFSLAFYHRVITDQQAVLWLPNYLDWFAGGMALAVLSCVPAETRFLAGPRRSLQVWANSGVTCVLVAAVLMGLVLLPLGMPRNLVAGLFWQWTAQHYLFLGCAFFLLLPLVLGRPGRAVAILGSPVAALMGSLSYSVYLWHPQLMRWWQDTLGWTAFSGQFPELFGLTLGSSVGVAAVSWFLLEKPAMNYSSRLLRRRSKPTIAPIPSATTHSS
jgi:peptidoglycan/LPS O-acetylase OafA/YrhL